MIYVNETIVKRVLVHPNSFLKRLFPWFNDISLQLSKGPSINYVGSLRGRGSANHQFLPIMPNVFAYEGGEGGQEFEKSCLRSL